MAANPEIQAMFLQLVFLELLGSKKISFLNASLIRFKFFLAVNKLRNA